MHDVQIESFWYGLQRTGFHSDVTPKKKAYGPNRQ